MGAVMGVQAVTGLLPLSQALLLPTLVVEVVLPTIMRGQVEVVEAVQAVNLQRGEMQPLTEALAVAVVLVLEAHE